jgi:hypothetical protein
MPTTLPDQPGAQQVKDCACLHPPTTTPQENTPHPPNATDRGFSPTHRHFRPGKSPPKPPQVDTNRPPPCCDIGNPMLDAPRRFGRPLFVHARASRGPT